MRKNLSVRYRFPVLGNDGEQKRRAVDQSPVGKQYEARNGYYHCDLYMLRLASDHGDKSLFDQLIQRLNGVPEGKSHDKTIQQLFDEWKPLYVQTPCEESAWLEYLHNVEPDLYDRLYGEEDKAYNLSKDEKQELEDSVPNNE